MTMELSRRQQRAVAIGVGVIAGCVLLARLVRQRRESRPQPPDLAPYEWTTVSFLDTNDELLGTADARVADTEPKHYVGLSNTDSLDDEEGMLFVHATEESQSYVMRNMSVPLDIVFVDADRVVTAIHHAELPAPGTPHDDLNRYRGEAMFVLEVPYEFTDRIGLTTGDYIRIAEMTDEPSE